MDIDFQLVAIMVVSCIIIYSVYSYLTQDKTPHVAPPKVNTFKADLTQKQLEQYNGVTKNQVFVALKGVIYDVSNSEFYRKPSGYAVFAGYDASVNMARMSHEPELLNKFGEIQLNSSQTQTLQGWVVRFQGKYPVVGKVIKAQ